MVQKVKRQLDVHVAQRDRIAERCDTLRENLIKPRSVLVATLGLTSPATWRIAAESAVLSQMRGHPPCLRRCIESRRGHEKEIPVVFLAWPHFPLLTSTWPLDGCLMQGSMTHSPDTLCRFPALWAHAPPRTCPARSHATATSHDSPAYAVAMPIHAPQACAGLGLRWGHEQRRGAVGGIRTPVPQHPMPCLLPCLPVFTLLRSALRFALMLLRPALRGNTCAVWRPLRCWQGTQRGLICSVMLAHAPGRSQTCSCDVCPLARQGLHRAPGRLFRHFRVATVCASPRALE